MQKEKKPVMFWILAGAIIVLLLIFSIQNLQSTTIKILFLDVKGPLFIVIAIVFFLGFFLGRLWSIIKKRKDKKEYTKYKELNQDNL